MYTTFWEIMLIISPIVVFLLGMIAGIALERQRVRVYRMRTK